MKEKNCPIRKTSIGGQALIEGVMMRGPKRTAMTVRDPDGNLVVECWDNEENTRAKFFKLPVVRGVFNFIDSMVVGVKCLLYSAEFFEEEEENIADGFRILFSPVLCTKNGCSSNNR